MINHDLISHGKKKPRIVKNGIPPSSTDGPVMTVKSTSIEKPLKERGKGHASTSRTGYSHVTDLQVIQALREEG